MLLNTRWWGAQAVGNVGWNQKRHINKFYLFSSSTCLDLRISDQLSLSHSADALDKHHHQRIVLPETRLMLSCLQTGTSKCKTNIWKWLQSGSSVCPKGFPLEWIGIGGVDWIYFPQMSILKLSQLLVQRCQYPKLSAFSVLYIFSTNCFLLRPFAAKHNFFVVDLRIFIHSVLISINPYQFYFGSVASEHP